MTPGSAAERAGIKQGDIIESFNGQAVHDTNSLRNHVADAEPGSSASMAILRNGLAQTLTVKLDAAKADAIARAESKPGSDEPLHGGSSGELVSDANGRVARRRTALLMGYCFRGTRIGRPGQQPYSARFYRGISCE